MRSLLILIGLALLGGCANNGEEQQNVNTKDTIPATPEGTLTPISTGTFVFYNT